MGNDFSNSAGTIITSYLMNTYNQNQNFHDFQVIFYYPRLFKNFNFFGKKKRIDLIGKE